MDTGVETFGALPGDRVKVGANAVIAPGAGGKESGIDEVSFKNYLKIHILNGHSLDLRRNGSVAFRGPIIRVTHR